MPTTKVPPFESQTNITDGGLLRICCSDVQCSSTPFNLHCKKYVLIDFFCNKLSSGIFCKFGFGCGGMVGDTPITTNTTFREGCAYHNVSLATMADYLVTVPLANFTGLEHGYALYIWPRSSSFPRWDNCGWDNGGWTCAFVSMDTDKDCRLQWSAPWPGPADKNPSIFTLSTTSSILITSTSSLISPSATIFTSTVSNFLASSAISPSEDNPHLAEKIAIPIGTTIGVGSGSGLVYWLWRRKKKIQQLENQSREAMIVQNGQEVDNELIELPVIQNLEDNLAIKSQQENQSESKKKELEQLINETKIKIGSSLEVALETFLDAQTELIEGNNTFAIRQLQREAKEKLQTKLSPAEIDNLVQRQTELIQLQQQTQPTQVGRSQYQAQIEVNPYLAFKN